MLTLGDIMQRDVVTVSPDMTLRDAADVLSGSRITGAPVVENGKVIGVLSQTDIVDFEAAIGRAAREAPPVRTASADPVPTFFGPGTTAPVADVRTRDPAVDRDPLGAHSVREAMSSYVFFLPSYERVERAAEYMRDARVHRVLVMEGERLSGIVTTTDVTRVVADGSLTRPRYLFNADGFEAVEDL